MATRPPKGRRWSEKERLWRSFQAVNKVASATLSRIAHHACAHGAASAPCKESLVAQGFSLALHIPQGTFSCRYAAIHLGSLLAIKSQELRPLTIPERLFRQAERSACGAPF